MSAAKQCPACDLYFDDSFSHCPYCGSRNGTAPISEELLETEPGPATRTPAQVVTNIRNPWVAVLWSILFLGCGHWYCGRRNDGLKFLFSYMAVATMATLLVGFLFSLSFTGVDLGIIGMLSFYAALGTVIIAIIVILAIFVYAAYDAYQTAQRINRGELEFVRMSRLFWIVAIYFVFMLLLIGAMVSYWLIMLSTGQ